jgi:spermidine/putrescine transport system ATP-binding protein
MVFQGYALWPHMTVAENVAFPLKVRGLDRRAAAAQVDEILELVGLGAWRDNSATALSGGQQQRVALARVLVLQPAVVLLDEPLGALDAKIRRALQVELKALQERVGLTFIYVTHDQEEALTMSDRLAVMNGGRVEQIGPPRLVYEQPQTTFVADFLGISNLLRGTALGRTGDLTRVRVGEFELHAGMGELSALGETKLLIRPERVRLEPSGSDGENRVPGMVERVVYRGSSNQVFIRLPNGDQVQAFVQNAGDATPFAGGDPVRIYLPPEALRVLADTPTGRVGPEAEQGEAAGTANTPAAIGGT